MPSKRLSWLDSALGELERRSRRAPSQHRAMMSLKTRHWTATLEALGGPLSRLGREMVWALPVSTPRGSCIFLVDRINWAIHVFDPAGTSTDDMKSKMMEVARSFQSIKKLAFQPYRFVVHPCPFPKVRR
jgi:hypothetical protein